MSEQQQALVVPPGAGTWLSWLGHPIRHLAVGDDTGGTYAFSTGPIPAGGGPTPHRHDFAEAFYVLGGEAEFRAGNRTARLGAGGFLAVGPGTAHAFRSVGPGDLELMVLVGPAGFDRFQAEAGRVVGPDGPDGPDGPFEAPTPEELERMKELAPRFGIDLDPPAEAFEVEPDLVVRRPGEGRAIDIVGDTYTFLVTGDESSGRLALWHATVPPGGGPPPHIQTREHEGFYVLDGTPTFWADGRRVEAPPGTFLNIPPGCLHRFRNETDRPARMLIFVAPAGAEGLFFEAGRPKASPDAPTPPPSREDIERIVAVAPKYGVTILPPDDH